MVKINRKLSQVLHIDSGSLWFLLMSLAFFVFLHPVVASGEQVLVMDKQVEHAVVDEDWAKVAKLLDYVTPETPSPVLRMIKGHADLALNRNNESLTLFYSLTVEEMKIYEEWSEKFISRHRGISIAYYFQGDIYARIGELDIANKHFTKSIEISNNNFLAWNARGVVSTLRKEYDDSLKDFIRTLNLKPDFNDVKNNIGMMRIQQGQGRKGAIKQFQSIIKSDPGFALAYHGLGCLELLKKQQMLPEENQNFQKALGLLPGGHDLLIINEARFKDIIFDKQTAALFADTGREGTTIRVNYSPPKPPKNEIMEAVKQASVAHGKYLNSNVLNKTANEKRLRHTQRGVAQLAMNTRASDWNKFSESEKAAITNNIDAYGDYYSKLEVSSRSGKSFHKNQSQALEIVGTVSKALTIMDPDPQTKTLAATFGLASDKWQKNSNYLAKGYGNSASEARDMSASLHKLSNTIKTSGNVQSLRTGRSSISAQNSISNNGGATTNKASITWDENEWPFLPIFGLLYFAPQMDLTMNGV